MLPMIDQPRKLLHCYRCGYRWFERQGSVKHGPPRQCPSCHSERWHTRMPYDPHHPRRRRKKEAS